MTITVTERGTGSHNTSATSFPLSPGSNLGAGMAVLMIAADNSASGGTPENFTSVTDTLGNVWIEQRAFVFDPGAANAGVQGAIYTTDQSHGLLTTGTTITVTFGASTTAKVWCLRQVSPSAGNEIRLIQPVTAATGNNAGANTAAPTATTSSLLVGEVVLCGLFGEFGSGSGYADDVDTTNGNWSTGQLIEVGTTTSGISLGSQYKIQTTTPSTQTWDPTYDVAHDCIIGWIVLREVTPEAWAHYPHRILPKRGFPAWQPPALVMPGRWPAPATGIATTPSWISDGSGFYPWGSPGFAETSNNLRTAVTIPNLDEYSDGLDGTGWGFSIPAGATINGVQMTVEMVETGGGDMAENGVYIFKSGHVFSTNKATFVNVPATEIVRVYGGPEDKWGLTLSADDINNSGFGCLFGAFCNGVGGTLGVDQITLRVYYTPAVVSGDLSWKPEFQERTFRKGALRTASQDAYFAPERQPEPPELSWSTVYPSAIAKRRALSVALQQSQAIPDRQPDPPALAWRGVYPGAINRRAPLSAANQDAFTTPDRQPEPPSDWVTHYPDRTGRRALLSAAEASWFGSLDVAVPAEVFLSWLAIYPDAFVITPDGIGLLIAEIGPIYPIPNLIPSIGIRVPTVARLVGFASVVRVTDFG